MANIICWPVKAGYDEKIWSCVEFVKPSTKRLCAFSEYQSQASTHLKERSVNPQELFEPAFLDTSAKSMNMLMPIVTKATTTYLCGANLRR